MVVMASARDLITIFVALELLSIPAYMMATWRKRDLKSNEAGLKYYLMGVFASAVMLYGMSLTCSASSGSTVLGRHQRHARSPTANRPLGMEVIGIVFVVSASPSRSRPCRSTSGRPTPTRVHRRPVTAFLAVASEGRPASSR